ncbi:MAG: flagellar filament capping protein FliD, partial [Ignavibacteriaceae bacterium]|nr:flagellar filament capping protein FliD [Ignavibacteriaceae bacterium]
MSDTSSVGSTSSTSSSSSSGTYTSSIGQQIDTMVTQFTASETTSRVTPLENKQKQYSNLTSAYDALSTKLTDFKSSLTTLKLTGTSDVFGSKTATSSDDSFVTATATAAASTSGYQIRVNQLAKSDVLISQDKTSADSSSLGGTGTQTFDLVTGGGTDGTYTSHVAVTFDSSETNKTAMQKVASAINQNKATVTSSAVTGTAAYTGGPSTFTINLNGTSQNITVNGGGTYDDLLNELYTNITAKVSGVTVAKLTDTPSAGQEQLQLTVKDQANYVSISSSSGNDIVSSLGIGVTKLKSAAGMVTASVFSPTTTTSQLSLTAAKTGLDYRIENLTDTNSSSALTAFGLNVGSTRNTFSQTTSPNTAGYIYSDTTTTGNSLNAKLVFNSLTIQRNSNSISDLATGVTFNLKAEMQTSDTTANITVSNDVATIETDIKDFITKFNAVYTNIQTNSVSSETERGTFVGDSNARSIMYKLTTTSYSKVSGIAAGNLNNLVEIGISFDTTNGLSISDETKLKNALTDHADQVGAIFNSSSGIANTLYNTVNPYLGAGGYLAKAKKIYNNDITDLSNRITSVKSEIDKEGQTLRQQYVNLQTSLSSMQASYAIFGFGSTSSNS